MDYESIANCFSIQTYWSVKKDVQIKILMKSSDIVAKRGSLLFSSAIFSLLVAITNRPLVEQPIRMQDAC